jgi:hypothetical protein
MANPTFVSASSSPINGVGGTATMPTGTVAGDLLLAEVTSPFANDANFAAPGTWTLIGAKVSAGSYETIRVLRRFVGAGDPTTETWTISGNPGIVNITAWRGVNATTPIEAFANTASWSGSTTTFTAPTVTATSSDATLVCLFGGNTGSAITYSSIGTLTERIKGTNNKSGAIFSEALSASGATGTRSVTSSVSTGFAAFSVLLAPAAGDTTAPVLSSPVGTTTGTSTATVGATTDEANGTLYAVVTTSATQPTVAQIKAGQNNGGTAAAYASSQSVTSTGAKTFSATGLTASTTYFAHLVHTDAASNDSNRVTSASFTTNAPGVSPSITTQPANTSRKVGQTATFTVTATGDPTLTYQWRLGGSNISGATSASYTTPTLAIGDNGGVYSVVVSNGSGSATSSNATLTVTACTLTFTEPIGGFVGATVSSLDRDDSVSYRWYVFSLGAVLGTALHDSGAVNTSGTGVPPAITDSDLQFGVTYRVVGIRQSDNELAHGELTAA